MAATTPAHHHVVDHDLDEDEEGLANGNGDTSKVICLHPSAVPMSKHLFDKKEGGGQMLVHPILIF